MTAHRTIHISSALTLEPAWFTSSYSSQDGGNCVEVALTPRTVKVRDSKDTTRPGLTLAAETWSAFIAHLG
jgi:hypothetical protein